MRIPLAIVLAAAAFTSPACGGDDETTTTTTTTQASGASGASGTGAAEAESRTDTLNGNARVDDGDQIEQAVAAVLGGTDPTAACVTSATANYVNSAYGDEQGCRAAVEGQGAFEVEINRIVIDSATAELTAVPAGGPNEGEDLTVRLVEESGEWKVDFLRSDAPAGP